jgi:hypothetical protein
MTYDEMSAALKEAERTMNVADTVATWIARLLVGRLRKVSSESTLVALKRELRDFDSRTGRWAP